MPVCFINISEGHTVSKTSKTLCPEPDMDNSVLKNIILEPLTYKANLQFAGQIQPDWSLNGLRAKMAFIFLGG